MKRWDTKMHAHVELPEVDAFMADIMAACEKHGMCLAHEDGHGSFIVERLTANNRAQLNGAMVEL